MKADHRILLIVLEVYCFCLAACNTQTMYPAHISEPTLSITPKPTSNPSFTPTLRFDATLQPFILPDYIVRIVYIDPTNNLFVWSTDGIDKQLTTTGDIRRVRISSDGKMIVFIRGSAEYSAQSVWLINFDGGNERVIIPEDKFESIVYEDGVTQWIVPAQIEWLDETHKIIFDTELIPSYGYSPKYDLWSLNAETDTYLQILPEWSGGLFFLSPDQKTLVFDREDSIGFIKVNGTQFIQNAFSYDWPPTYREGPEYAIPVWSSDSLFVLVAIMTTDPMENNLQSYTIYQIPANGATPQVVANIEAFFEGVFISPDGKKVAYMTEEYKMTSLHIMNLGDGNDSVIATGDIWFDSWNIDSTGFVYNIYDYKENPRDIYISNIGEDRIPLTEYINISAKWNLEWIDSEYFIFYVHDEYGWHLRMGRIGSISHEIKYLRESDDSHWHQPLFDFAIIDG